MLVTLKAGEVDNERRLFFYGLLFPSRVQLFLLSRFARSADEKDGYS